MQLLVTHKQNDNIISHGMLRFILQNRLILIKTICETFPMFNIRVCDSITLREVHKYFSFFMRGGYSLIYEYSYDKIFMTVCAK